MYSVKEKIKNMVSAAKEKITICRAKAVEKAEKAAARTKEEKRIAKERRKAREAGAKMELHQEKAQHAAETQRDMQMPHMAEHDVYGRAHPHVGAHDTMGPMVTSAAPYPQPAYPPVGGEPYMRRPV